MESDIRQLLVELREDHRNMMVVLDLLKKTADFAESGEDPDFDLIEEIMHYMTVYPDAIHHPKEDLIYAELQTHRPDLSDGLDDVPEDHWQIAALGTRLCGDLRAIAAGAAVRRDQFVIDLNQYIQKLRNHIRWEEEDLFPRIDTMIDDDPHRINVGESLHVKDPIFQLEVEKAFKHLMASLNNN